MSGRGRGGALSKGISFVKRETLQPCTGEDDSTSDHEESRPSFSMGGNSAQPLMSLSPSPQHSFQSGGSASNFSGQGPQNSGRPQTDFSHSGFNVPRADPVLHPQEYFRLWKEEKDPELSKLRKLAHEVLNLSTDRPNAVDKTMSACNRVPLKVEFRAEKVKSPANNGTGHFNGIVEIGGVDIGSGEGKKLKDAKTCAFSAALQKLFMPHLRIVPIDPVMKELQASMTPFTSPPRPPSKQRLAKFNAPVHIPPDPKVKREHMPNSGYFKESNIESINKRHLFDSKRLEDFCIVEPLVPVPDCTPTHTLRRSADFNRSLLELEFMATGPSVKCVLKLENKVLADVSGENKIAARNRASDQALKILRRICYVMKTKQACDSDTLFSKEEMMSELNEAPGTIKSDNVGHRMLQKMGWSGGGVGKTGSGIANPVELTSVLNRQGLGLSTASGITDEFRKKMREKIEEYASSDRQDDLVFAKDFTNQERMIIHDECRKLNLKSKSRGKGKDRYLCARRKRDVNELFEHIMAQGGETFRYVLCPPGSDSGTLDSESEAILEELRKTGVEVEVDQGNSMLNDWKQGRGMSGGDGWQQGGPQSVDDGYWGGDNGHQNMGGNHQQGFMNNDFRNRQLSSDFGYQQQSFNDGNRGFDRGNQMYGGGRQDFGGGKQGYGGGNQGFGGGKMKNSGGNYRNSPHDGWNSGGGGYQGEGRFDRMAAGGRRDDMGFRNQGWGGADVRGFGGGYGQSAGGFGQSRGRDRGGYGGGRGSGEPYHRRGRF